MIRSYTNEYNRQWSITSALYYEYSYDRPLSSHSHIQYGLMTQQRTTLWLIMPLSTQG